MSTFKQDQNPKQAILLGAFKTLMKNGLPSLSYDAISEETGLSRQLIRYHFEDKDSLMIAVCDHLAASYRDSLIASVMQAEGKNRLQIFLDFYFDLLTDMPKPRDDQVYDALIALASGSPRIRENLRSQYSLLGHILSHEFELQYPSLGNQGSKELSYLFVCLMYGHWKMVASLGLSEEHKHITRKAMDRLVLSYVDSSIEMGALTPIWKPEVEG